MSQFAKIPIGPGLYRRPESGEAPKPRLSINELATRRHRCGELKAAGLPCPDDPASVMSDLPYERPIVRHLAYHVAPFMGNGIWQRNLAQLRRRMHLFNGRRTVAIVTGIGLDPPDLVKRAFGDDVDDYLIYPNMPHLREVVTFVPLLSRCSTTAPYDCVFVGHCKGVTRPVDDGVTVHRWTEIMYETCLDYWPVVERALLKHSLAGSFKKIGMGFLGSRSSWHYSGAFYWLRNARAFARLQWREVDSQWTGTEAWPGLHFAPHEGACIFHESTVPKLDMYSMDYLKGTVEPAYAAWREQHEHERTVWASR